jgi:DNA ligase-1
MTLISKPLLAVNFDESLLKYPVYATPKIDGIRCLKIKDTLVSRSMKPLKNKFLVERFTSLIPNGSDGELVLENSTFQETTSFVNSHNPSNKEEKVVVFYWFDYVKESLEKGYLDRMVDLETDYNLIKGVLLEQECVLKVIPLLPKMINNKEELLLFESDCLDKGFEGVMLREGGGLYKCGRSTLKQQVLLKVKRFQDTEAKIVGFEELLHNENEKQTNELNLSFRSSKKEGKRSGNTLGSFIVEMDFNDKQIQFKIGTGFSQEERLNFWNTRDTLLNKLVKFKYFEIGVKNSPRHPVFLGIRDPDDM